MNGYGDEDRQRWAPEPPKRRDRTAFERDRARVLHSAALRRLAAKTQVSDPGADDFLRTRLTHSLECAQVGRELGKSLGCDPDLVETACLAHDIGHPPFGHNGETALDIVARDCGGFEGNAQSLRILTRLEPKSFAADGRSVGLNLTRAVLDASMKYPWRRSTGPKFGIYDDDADVAEWVRAGAPAGRTCFEAQVMDWSDDVAYSVHDLEDALVAGHIDFRRLADPAERRLIAETAIKLYVRPPEPLQPGTGEPADPADIVAGAETSGTSGTSGTPGTPGTPGAADPADGADTADPERPGEPVAPVTLAELEERFTELLAQPSWPAFYDGTPRSLAALKNLTSTLIGRFCVAAEDATRAAYGPGPLTRYAADLIVPRAPRLECALLKGITAHYVWVSHRDTRARQRELIIELAEAMIAGAPGTLTPAFRGAFDDAADDGGRLRAVVDQLASLTDTSAISLHRRLCG